MSSDVLMKKYRSFESYFDLGVISLITANCCESHGEVQQELSSQSDNPPSQGTARASFRSSADQEAKQCPCVTFSVCVGQYFSWISTRE